MTGAEYLAFLDWLEPGPVSLIGPKARAWQSDPTARVTRARVSGPKDIPLEIALPSGKGLKVNKSEKLPAGVLRTEVAGGLRLRFPQGGEFALEWAN